jgi:hypothetical protein
VTSPWVLTDAIRDCGGGRLSGTYAGPDVALGRTLPASNDVVFTEPLNSPMVRPEVILTFVFGGSQSQRVLNLD